MNARTETPALLEREGQPVVATPRVSVVIPTCGRPILLQRCLDALIGQDVARGTFEVVVCDDGHTDDIRALVERLGVESGIDMRYFRSRVQRDGPAGARNVGWRNARGEIVAFTDDDTIPAPDWLSTGLKHMRPDVGAITGRTIVPLPEEPTDWALNTAGLERGEFLTANAFVWRTLLEEVGGFDERYKRPWREDSDMQFAMLERGWRIERVNEAVVTHPVRSAPWGVSLKMQKNVFFDALLYKKHPTLYRQRVSRKPPWRYYAVVGALAVGVGGLIAGEAQWAALGLGAWLCWTVWFTAFRLKRTTRRLSHVAEMFCTSAVIPPLAVFWRLAGALHFKVAFA